MIELTTASAHERAMLTAPRKARKPARSPEQIKHDCLIKRAQLIREARLFKMQPGIRRASFTLNGEHVDMYASKEYRGYGYKVTCGDAGYECGCEQFENRHDGCIHTKDASARAKARYAEAKRAAELATAEQVAPLIVGPESASDMSAHVDDSLSGQADGFVDPFAGMTKEQQREAYRALYPDDFYSAA